jgi:hypothetical protein
MRGSYLGDKAAGSEAYPTHHSQVPSLRVRGAVPVFLSSSSWSASARRGTRFMLWEVRVVRVNISGCQAGFYCLVVG